MGLVTDALLNEYDRGSHIDIAPKGLIRRHSDDIGVGAGVFEEHSNRVPHRFAIEISLSSFRFAAEDLFVGAEPRQKIWNPRVDSRRASHDGSSRRTRCFNGA